MVNQEIARRPEKMPLSIEEVGKYISPLASEQEAYVFLRFCEAQGLNPFINEAYLIKYDRQKPAAIVIGVAALLKRAARNPAYRGYQSGIVVKHPDGELSHIEGSIVPPGAELFGGWCTLSRADRDLIPRVAVPFSEYTRNQALWKDKPATMIEKVALAQALRRSFPEDTEELAPLPMSTRGVAVVDEGQEVSPPPPDKALVDQNAADDTEIAEEQRAWDESDLGRPLRRASAKRVGLPHNGLHHRL